MRLTETINTIEQLESISFDGVIYLVRIKTDKPGNHYISGFHSEVQARKYQSLLHGLEFDKSFAQVTTTEEVSHHLTVSCTITSITPVNEYIIQKTDAIYSISPELTSKDLLVRVNDSLTPKQVEQEIPDADNTLDYIREWEIECGKVEKTAEEIKADELDLKEWEDSFKTADDLAWEEACRVDDEVWLNGQNKLIEQIAEARDRASLKIQAEKKLKAHPLTVTNRSLREQTLDASAKILQHSLGNMMFRAEGLHPISDSTIHIQLDNGNDELDISFWYLLGAFKTNDPNQIDDKLCAALFHHGKIDGKKLSSVQLIRNALYFTI